MNRKQLKSLVSYMFAIVFIGFVYVLFSSLGSNTKVEAGVDRFSDIKLGQTVMRRVDGQRVWLTHFSNQQLKQTKLLEPFLINSESGCGVNIKLCAVLAAVSGNGLELSYSLLPPPQINGDDLWIGGFVDPTTGAVFDLLGRAYRLNRPSDVQTLELVELD